ncbi:MAG: MSMEG_4193 family putative phosphomutase [Chloroflexota bacterium]
MPTIVLIRHGENDLLVKGHLAGRMPGIGLNEKGRRQARDIAEALSKAPVKAVYSSPLERAMETAEPIAQALGLSVIPRSGLIEIDFGDWQNRSLKQLHRLKLWKVVVRSPSLARFPGGETFAQAQSRIVDEIENLNASHNPKDTFVCVTHSDVIKLAVAYYLGLPLDMFQRLVIAPASITTINLLRDQVRLINLNQNIPSQCSDD